MSDYSYLSSLVLSNAITELEFSNDLTSSLKRFLIEMKMQVDRWDLVVDSFIFHSKTESFILNFLSKDISFYNGKNNIWGATLIFTDSISGDNVFAVSSIKDDSNDENRNVALGILPSENVKKYYELKAFW